MKQEKDLVLRKISPRLNAVLDEHQALKKRHQGRSGTEPSSVEKTEDYASSVTKGQSRR